MRSLLKNLGYQTLYQILAICLPLLTSPYISRVFGANGLGVYSYTYSIVNYFVIFAMLGVLSYGSKAIATVRDNCEKRTHYFWSIYYFQLFVSLLSLVGYYFFVLIKKPDNIQVALLQGIWIIGCVLDISWFFFGIENFKITVIRNSIIKILTVIAIFVFVKCETDVWKYTVIMSVGTVVSQLSLWPFLKRYTKFYVPTIKEIQSHIKANIMLFIPLLAMSIYHTMDKTMLGMFSSYTEVGYYYNADKVMNIPLSVITATGTVMLPKMSYLMVEGKQGEGYKLFTLTFELFMAITIAMSFGIVAVADIFVGVFFGEGYDRCIGLLYIFAVIMYFKSMSSIIRNQYLIPNNKEKVYTISVISGAVLNLIANVILIYYCKMGAFGATVATLIAEFVTCIFYIFFANKAIDIKKPLLKSVFYFVPGIGMFLIVKMIRQLNFNNVILLLMETCIGGLVFIGTCLGYWKLKRTE